MLPFLLHPAPIQHFRSCLDSDLLPTFGILVTVQFIGIRVLVKTAFNNVVGFVVRVEYGRFCRLSGDFVIYNCLH